MSATTASPQNTTNPKERIGLALSGGGFRASIFHLGVILRLEELGIMNRVSVISAVSGGSIVAAYYAYAMEDQLRLLPPGDWYNPAARVEAYKKVAREFLRKVRLNMRSRALVFSPRYHPWLLVKAVALRPFREHAFSILIQEEYDQHFYHDYSLDQLPAVPHGAARPTGGAPVLTGPKLLLNTTSLMTGERKAFSRDANTYLAQLKTSNKNVLKLSQVVGASSGVPVIFPPTAICGELLVDGGVSDNQGVEGLLPLPERHPREEHCPPPPDHAPVDTLLISDACGQLELKHTMSTGRLAVFSRVNDILMHQVRNKLLDLVALAKNAHRIRFAFIHLLLNLKDDGSVAKRVSNEFIEPLARIRTDLDQFSYIETEALMYHGYTLIDAMIRRWCREGLIPDKDEDIPPLKTPPLFLKKVHDNIDSTTAIRNELVAGSEKVFLFRCWKKFGWVRTLPIYLIAFAVWLWIVGYLFADPHRFVDPVVSLWQGWLDKISLPSGAGALIQRIKDALETIVNGAAGLAGVLTVLLLPAYVVVYLLWELMRVVALTIDRRLYSKLTKGADPESKGADPESLDWVIEPVDSVEPSPANADRG
ncbi:MAG: patatin-like phospholipase family protein [Bryobacteraceae bacterium]